MAITVRRIAFSDFEALHEGVQVTRPIHVSELCEHFNVTRRSLYRAFEDVLGLAPITFLRRKRLGDVHTALLRGGPSPLIKAVAIAHGFIDLSKFARDFTGGCSARSRPRPCSAPKILS
jgi:transcriptional regulator GlxA family with amidase domain